MTPHKLKSSLLTFDSVVCVLSSSEVYRILSSICQFSPWGRFWSIQMEITSFNSRVLAFIAVTVFWPVHCRVNSPYLFVVMEMFLYVLPRNQHLTMQCIASSVIFIAVETCSNNLPSSSGVFHVAMGMCSAKSRPADGLIAAFRRHVIIPFLFMCPLKLWIVWPIMKQNIFNNPKTSHL
jgi:hypothetical protein